MSVRDRDVRLASWMAPLGWLAAAACLALWVVAPTVLLDPRAFAWGTALCVVFAALGHLAILHRVHAPTRRRPPARHQGRGHSGERPRFD